MATKLSRTDLRRFRLVSQLLTRSTGLSATGVVEHMLALQGQDLPGVLWSIGQRSPGSDQDEIRAAFNSGELVRSWPFRGTLHVVRARDLPWILTLTGERTLAASATRRHELGLDSAAMTTAHEVARVALGAGPLTRTELLRTFDENGLRTDQGRGYHLLFALALGGEIVFGPFSGREHLIALTSDWIRAPRQLDSEAALRELVLRYIQGRGPVSMADLSWWSKLPLRDLVPALRQLEDTVTEFEYDGGSLWAHTETIDSVPNTRAVLALPGFDEYLLGYKVRSAVLSPEHAPLTVPGNNGVFKPTMIHRGKVVGIWSKKQTSRQFNLLFEPFSSPTPQSLKTGLGAEANRFARFLGLDSVVTSEILKETHDDVEVT